MSLFLIILFLCFVAFRLERWRQGQWEEDAARQARDRKLQAARRAAEDQLHPLWGRAVGTPGYDKRAWQDLQAAIQAIGQDLD